MIPSSGGVKPFNKDKPYSMEYAVNALTYSISMATGIDGYVSKQKQCKWLHSWVSVKENAC